MRGNIGWIVLSLLLIVVGWMSTRQVAIVSDAASPDSVSSDAVLSTTTASKYEPPPHLMIERAFFKCETSHSLEGGNFGKGPTKRFGPERPPCTSLEWKRISCAEFKQLATEWHGQRWESEDSFCGKEE